MVIGSEICSEIHSEILSKIRLQKYKLAAQIQQGSLVTLGVYWIVFGVYWSVFECIGYCTGKTRSLLECIGVYCIGQECIG